jgi:hypothetical protein
MKKVKRHFDESEFFDTAIGSIERWGGKVGQGFWTKTRKIVAISITLGAVAVFGTAVFIRSFFNARNHV